MAEDDTPRDNRRSGEWSEMDELRTTCNRIEKKLDAVINARTLDQSNVSRMDERLKSVESWRISQETDARQLSVGTKLAIVSGIASPVIIIVIELLRAH